MRNKIHKLKVNHKIIIINLPIIINYYNYKFTKIASLSCFSFHAFTGSES